MGWLGCSASDRRPPPSAIPSAFAVRRWEWLASWFSALLSRPCSSPRIPSASRTSSSNAGQAEAIGVPEGPGGRFVRQAAGDGQGSARSSHPDSLSRHLAWHHVPPPRAYEPYNMKLAILVRGGSIIARRGEHSNPPAEWR